MASHRIHFALGSYIQFGSLDFLCTRMEYDLVLLPPSVPVDRVTGAEEGHATLPRTRSADPPSDIDRVAESLGSLHL